MSLFCRDESEHQSYISKKEDNQKISLELEVLPKLSSSGKLFAYKFNNFWFSIKSAGSALYANREILQSYQSKHPELLACDSENCIGNVYIHPGAQIHSQALVSFH